MQNNYKKAPEIENNKKPSEITDEAWTNFYFPHPTPDNTDPANLEVMQGYWNLLHNCIRSKYKEYTDACKKDMEIRWSKARQRPGPIDQGSLAALNLEPPSSTISLDNV